MKYEIKENLSEFWFSMQNKYDLLALLNMALVRIYEDEAQTINIQHLNYYTYSSKNPKRYVSFQIPKKKQGEFRTIDAPCSGLKTIQQCLNILFHEIYTPNCAAMGFVPNRSIVDGARIHLHQKFVYNIDLKNFFPSITAGRLFHRLQSKPFSLNRDLASIITNLCCHTNAEGENVLPQGAPTSPTITNFICERLDRKLSKLANSYNLKYSRYADDITFSGMVNVFAEEGKFCQSLRHIIEEEESLKINTDKTRLLHRGNRQEVTGITVNEKPNVSRKYVKQLRTLIHNWEVLGYHEAQQRFLEFYKPTKVQQAIREIGLQQAGNVTEPTLITEGQNSLTGSLRSISHFGGRMPAKEFVEQFMPKTEADAETDYRLLRWFADLQIKNQGGLITDANGNIVFIEYAPNFPVQVNGSTQSVTTWLQEMHNSIYVSQEQRNALKNSVYPIKRLIGKYIKNFGNENFTANKANKLRDSLQELQETNDKVKFSNTLDELFPNVLRDINDCINLQPNKAQTEMSFRTDENNNVILTVNSVQGENILATMDVINLSALAENEAYDVEEDMFEFLYDCFFETKDKKSNPRVSPAGDHIPFAKFQVNSHLIQELNEDGNQAILRYASLFSVGVSADAKSPKNVTGEHHIENIISGKLDYLKMVKGETDGTYKKLRERFNTLIESSVRQKTFSPKEKNIENDFIQTDDVLNEFLELEKLLDFE